MSKLEFNDNINLGKDARLNLFIRHIKAVNDSLSESERIYPKDFRKKYQSHRALFGFNEDQANWFTTNYRLTHGFKYPDADQLLNIYMIWYREHKNMSARESRDRFINLFKEAAHAIKENQIEDKDGETQHKKYNLATVKTKISKLLKALKAQYPDVDFPNPLQKTRARSVKDAVQALQGKDVPW